MWDSAKFDKKEFWEQISLEDKSKIDWYGDYQLIENELKKEITSPKMSIFIPGGGFSTLACELSKQGCTDVIHSDAVASCVEQMKAKYEIDYPEIKFRVVDVLETPYPDKRFDIIIDKALLDSLYCEDTDEHREKAEKYLQQMARILRPKGKFIVMSLGQPYILRFLLRCFKIYFKSLDVRLIHPKFDDPHSEKPPLINTMPIVYMVFSHKNLVGGGIASSNLRCCDDYVDSPSDILSLVQYQQQIQFIQYLCNFTRDIGVVRFVTNSPVLGETHFAVVETQLDPSQVERDYVIVLLDDGALMWAQKHNASRVCFVFIDPSCYVDKQKNVVESVARFAATFQYVSYSMKEKVRFVNQKLDYIPVCFNYPIEFFPSKSNQLDTIKELLEDSHAYVVTRTYLKQQSTAAIESFCFERHLIFKCNPMTIQSTVSVDYRGNILNDNFTSEYHVAVLILLASIGCKNWNVTCIGLGGGQLSSSISTILPIKSIVSVEADKVVAKLASDFFGFKVTPTCSVVVKEGVEYILSMKPNSTDCLIFDVNNDDYKQDIVCPLPAFLEENVIDHAIESLTPNGVLILNVVTRSDAGLGSVLNSIRNKFPGVYSYLMEKEENVVVVAFKTKPNNPINVNIPHLMSYDQLKPFKQDELFKKVLKYLISKTYHL